VPLSPKTDNGTVAAWFLVDVFCLVVFAFPDNSPRGRPVSGFCRVVGPLSTLHEQLISTRGLRVISILYFWPAIPSVFVDTELRFGNDPLQVSCANFIEEEPPPEFPRAART
jgi:hypothetical protein